MQTLQDNRETMIKGEGVPQRRAADTPLDWIEEGPHATLMTPERVLALLGTFPNGKPLAQQLAEAVEIEVRKELGGEMQDLLDVVRALSFAAYAANNPKGQDAPVELGHPLHRMTPMVSAARRLCLAHGYSANGQDIFVEQPALNPEMMLERVEQGQRDFGHTYRWLRAEAKRAGFNYICEAIAYAAQAKKGGTQ